MNEQLLKKFDIVKTIKKTNNLLTKLEKNLVSKYNLTPSQYGVLECLYMKGDMCINKLIESQISSSGTMTVIVKNLEKMGYVNKENTCEDKRFFKVVLNTKGKSIVEKILPEREELLNDFASTISETDQNNLLKILHKFKDKYKEKKDE